MYKEITKEYIKEQEKLGVNDVLLKFIEWRTYIAFFGITLTDEDKEKLHKIAVQIKEKLLPDNEILLLSWINRTHIMDEENCSEELDQVTTDMVLAKSLIHPNIITEASQKDIKNQTEERDYLVFLCSPAKLYKVRAPHKIDTRLFELRILRESEQQSLYKDLWFEVIRTGRDLVSYFTWIEDNRADLDFVNNQDWTELTYNNYSLKQFLIDFNLGKLFLQYSPTIILSHFLSYVMNNFNSNLVTIKGRQI